MAAAAVGITNYGRIKFSDGRLSYGNRLENGYMQVNVQGKKHSVHRLVAKAFLTKPSNLHSTVEHIDANGSNNKMENLKWVTRSDLAAHMLGRGNGRKKNSQNASKRILVREIGESKWIPYSSLSELHRLRGWDRQKINQRLNGLSLDWNSKFEFKLEQLESDLLDGELWKNLQIDGFETKWKISNNGRLRSSFDIISRGTKGRGGYWTVNILRKNRYVHILVAESFLATRPSSLHTVNHIDEDKSNNCVSNLEWATRSEQMKKHSELKRKRGPERSRPSSKPLESSVIGTEIWERFDSAYRASKVLRMDCSNISRCLNGHIKTCNGRIFRFVKANNTELFQDEICVALSSLHADHQDDDNDNEEDEQTEEPEEEEDFENDDEDL